MDYTTSSETILEAIRSAGPDAVVAINDVGEYDDVLLWESAEHAQNDDGRRAVGRWSVLPATTRELRAAGIVEG